MDVNELQGLIQQNQQGQQQGQPAWATGLQTISKPFQWLNEHLDKPWATLITSPFSPGVSGTEGLSWWEREKAEYEAWEAPKGAKFFAEFSTPVYWIPWGAAAAGAGRLAAKGGLTAAARVLGTTAKVSKATGAITKASGVAGKIQKAEKLMAKPTEWALGKVGALFKGARAAPDLIDDVLRKYVSKFDTLDDSIKSIYRAYAAKEIGVAQFQNLKNPLLAELTSIIDDIPKYMDDTQRFLTSKVIPKSSKIKALGWADVVKNPENYKFVDDALEQFCKTYKGMNADLRAFWKANNLGIDDFDDWINRVVRGYIDKNGKFVSVETTLASRPGSLASFEKQGVYKSMSQGIHFGVRYKDPIKTMSHLIDETGNRLAGIDAVEMLKPLTKTVWERVPSKIRRLGGKTGLYSVRYQQSREAIKVIDRAIRNESLPSQTVKALGKVSPDLADEVARALAIPVSQTDDVIRNLSKEIQGQFDDALRNMGVREIATPTQLKSALNAVTKDTHKSDRLLAKIYKNAYQFGKTERKQLLNIAKGHAVEIVEKNKTILTEFAPVYRSAMAKARRLALTEGRMFDMPGLQNRIFVDQGDMTGREVIKKIHSLFAPKIPSHEVDAIRQATRMSVTAIAAMDVSGPLIQGAHLIGIDMMNALKGKPTAHWMKMVKANLDGIINPQSLPKYLTKNASFYAEHPNLMTGLSDFMAGLDPMETLASKAPKIGRYLGQAYKQSYGRMGAGFTAGGIVGRTEFAKSLTLAREAAQGAKLTATQLFDVDTFANALTGTASKLFISPRRQAYEGALLFAGNYLRSNLEVIKLLFKTGSNATVARDAIGGMMMAMFTGYRNISLAMGQTPYLDPRPPKYGGDGGKFMTIKVGETHYGLPGFSYGMMRLLAGVAGVAAEDPKAMISVDWRENPALYFLMSRASPAVGLANEVITGKDFMGRNLSANNPDDWAKVLGEKITPIMLQNLLWRREEGTEWTSIFGEVAGARTFPVSDAERRNTLRNSYAMEEHGQPWDDLPQGKQGDLIRAHPDLEQMTQKVKDEMSLERGSEFQRAYTLVNKAADDYFNAEMDVVANNFAQGNIGFTSYNDRRKELLVQHSAEKNSTYKMKEHLDKKSIESIDKWIEDNQKSEDRAMEEYRNILRNVDKDAMGLPDWESTYEKADKYLASLDAPTRQYINEHYRDWIKELPDLARTAEELRESLVQILIPYWRVRTEMLNQNPRIKDLIERIKRMQVQDPERAKAFLAANPGINQIINRFEKQLRLIRSNMRRNKELDRAVMLWYT